MTKHDDLASSLTAFEYACLHLRILHLDLPRWLYDLIEKANQCAR